MLADGAFCLHRGQKLRFGETAGLTSGIFQCLGQNVAVIMPHVRVWKKYLRQLIDDGCLEIAMKTWVLHTFTLTNPQVMLETPDLSPQQFEAFVKYERRATAQGSSTAGVLTINRDGSVIPSVFVLWCHFNVRCSTSRCICNQDCIIVPCSLCWKQACLNVAIFGVWHGLS